MPNPATVREQRSRKTKAQLIDEIDTLEQREAKLRLALDSMPGLPPCAALPYIAPRSKHL